MAMLVIAMQVEMLEGETSPVDVDGMVRGIDSVTRALGPANGTVIFIQPWRRRTIFLRRTAPAARFCQLWKSPTGTWSC